MTHLQNIIIDCGLSFFGGHHPAHLKAVLSALAARSNDTCILSNQDTGQGKANAEVNGIPLYPVLPVSGYEGISPLSGSPEHLARQEALAARQLAEAFRAQDQLFQNAQKIYVLNVTPVVIAALHQWIEQRNQALTASLALYLLTGIGVSAFPDMGGINFVETNPRHRQIFECAFNVLAKNVPTFSLHVTSNLRRKELEFIGASDVSLYAITMTKPPRRSVPMRPSQGHVLLHAGDTKIEKGSWILPFLAAQMVRILPEKRMLIHLNGTGPRFSELLNALLDIAKSHPNLIIKQGFLPNAEYQSLLGQACLVVLLHEIDFYHDMESGLANECFAAGIPVLCRSGTLSARSLKSWGGHRFIYEMTSELVMRISEMLAPDSPIAGDFTKDLIRSVI
jgi:hypothetical protein